MAQPRSMKVDDDTTPLTGLIKKRQRRKQPKLPMAQPPEHCPAVPEAEPEPEPDNESPAQALRCAKCYQQFGNLAALGKHETKLHMHKCTFEGCGLWFVTSTELDTHKAKHGVGRNLYMHDGKISMGAPTLRKWGRRRNTKKKKPERSQTSSFGGNIARSGYVNRSSFKPRNKNEKWSPDETGKFYKFLAMYGSNFALLAALFANRTRKQLKNKFKKEEREHPDKINDALVNRLEPEMTVEEFEVTVKKNMELKATAEKKRIAALSGKQPEPPPPAPEPPKKKPSSGKRKKAPADPLSTRQKARKRQRKTSSAEGVSANAPQDGKDIAQDSVPVQNSEAPNEEQKPNGDEEDEANEDDSDYEFDPFD